MTDSSAMAVDGGSTSAPAVMVPDDLLIGFGGKLELKESGKPVMEGRANIFDFIAQFKAKHSLKGEANQPIIKLLQMGGMSRERITREILNVLVAHYKKIIPDMTQVQLSLLLDHSYSYLTVPELRPIATLVLERLYHVDLTTWQAIVDNGLTESPYVDLPINLKRRIWHAISSSFDFELSSLIRTIPDYDEATTLEELVAPKPRAAQRNENKCLQQFMRLLGDDADLLVPFIDKMVEVSAMEASPPRRRAYANMLQDVLCMTSKTKMPNVEKLREMARSLDVGGVGNELTIAQVRDIRDGLEAEASCGAVALLVSSAYARDLVTAQLVEALVLLRKLIPKKLEPADVAARAAELRSDPMLIDLTYIVLSSVRSKNLLVHNIPLENSEAEEQFRRFFPFVCREAAIDDVQLLDSFFSSNARAPHAELLQAVRKGPFERRVLVQYSLMLMTHGNIVALSKMRLVLDFVLQRADTAEEAKECFVANELIIQIMDT